MEAWDITSDIYTSLYIHFTRYDISAEKFIDEFKGKSGLAGPKKIEILSVVK